MKQVESPFNIGALSSLIRIPVEPGYEIATMDMVADVLDEQGLGDEVKDSLYPFFDAILFNKDLPKINEETKRFLQQNRHEFAQKYEILRDLNHPGYLILKATIERDGSEPFYLYAMELGCPSAARILAQRQIHEGRYADARSNLSWAVLHGDMLAYSDYGNLVFDLEDDDDHRLSYSIFKEGAEAGNSECALEIVERDLFKGGYEPWIEIARKLHNPRWHSVLAQKLLHAYGKKQQGIDELSAGMEDGDEESYGKMGRVYLTGIEECSIAPDLDMAIEYTEPFAEKYAEAGYVNATAKLKQGKDVVDSLKRLAYIADTATTNPHIKGMAVLELGKAYFGDYGDEAKESIRSAVMASTLQKMMPTHFPSMDPMAAMEVVQLIEKIEKAAKEENNG